MGKGNNTGFFNSPKLPRVVIILLLAFYIATNFSHKNWKQDEGPIRGVIKWDIISYYGYLPAAFIYKDLSLEFAEQAEFRDDNKFWFQKTGIGKNVIITSMGMSYLYAPFFFMAHALAPVFGQPADGFHSIYQFFLVFSAILYLAIGYFCLSKLLLRYFRPGVTALSLLLIGIGTNLYYYSTHEAALTHSFSFSLISALFLVIVNWYEKQNWQRSLLFGFLLGLIVLIRPSNILVLIPFLLWEVNSLGKLVERLRFFLRSWPYVVLMLAAFLLPWVPQFLYWKEVSGQLIYNSYAGVGSAFYFDNPHILHFLISYRKGWFVYTPLMLLAIAGFLPLYRKNPGIFFPLAIYLVISIYVLSSWWSWWYGGCFGMRAMIDMYGLLAIPLAALLSASGKWIPGLRISLAGMVIFIVFLNIFQTYQYKEVLIHWVGMTKTSYWTIFLRAKDRYGYWQNLREPDYELARKGIYVYYPVIGKDERLLEMEKEEGKEYILYYVRKDRSLIRDIKKYARRNDISRMEALDMVLERMYFRLTE